jgi:hypothetical protein
LRAQISSFGIEPVFRFTLRFQLLRHQIAVLERSRTRRPCFHRFDRLLWILLSRWWPQWRESLMIVDYRWDARGGLSETRVDKRHYPLSQMNWHRRIELKRETGTPLMLNKRVRMANPLRKSTTS